MSPTRSSKPRTPAASAALRTFFALFGAHLNEARLARRWTAQRLATEAGLSRGLVYLALRGEQVSLDAALRLATALGLKFDWELVDARRRDQRAPQRQDVVHSAMGEFEAAHLRPLGFPVSMDEPYQHYQFAGRADVVVWDLDSLALLHMENRTRFPDFQETAGAFNAKRAYLGAALAERFGVRGWRSETHVVVALWSSEVLHALRLRSESFRSLCPADSSAFAQWWSGKPPSAGKSSTLVVLDPLSVGRQRPYLSFDDALKSRPRHRGYADIAQRLTGVAA